MTERLSSGSSTRVPHPVVLAGIVLVAVQVAVRAWASAGSWFIGDDFNLMTRLYDVPLTLTELFTPHDSQLMPGGILSAWVMANAGPQNWTVAASILVVLQAIASASCLLMLVTVFGRRGRSSPCCSSTSRPRSPSRRTCGGRRPSTRSRCTRRSSSP